MNMRGDSEKCRQDVIIYHINRTTIKKLENYKHFRKTYRISGSILMKHDKVYDDKFTKK